MNKSLSSGTRLSSPDCTYTITQMIGCGGFGITYKATMPTKVRNISTRIDVAIKEHFPAADCERAAGSPDLTYSHTASQRVQTSLKEFVDEAQCLQRIAGLHPNIVNVNEVFQANNTAYYVMEYLEGETLKHYVMRKGHLSPAETLSIMMPIIEAAATLHRNKFTHLDIKPSNIMLTTDDNDKLRPVLIDFGLARHYNSDGSATNTLAAGGFSDGYAPVEQYSGVTCYSPHVDVYALGATILFCLTGKTPPRSVDVSPSTLSNLIPRDTPDSLRKLLNFCMAFQACDRIPNAQQLLLSLKPVAATLGTVITDSDTTVLTADHENTVRVSDDTVISAPPAAPIDERTVISDMRPYGNSYPPPPVNTDDRYKREIASSRTPIWIWVTIAALIVGLVIAIVLLMKESNPTASYTSSTSEVNVPVMVDDTHNQPVTEAPAAEIDEATAEEALVEMTTPVKLDDGVTTPDLGFHSLSGPVKSCTNHWGANIPFDKEGNWTGNYSDNLGPRTFGRDSYGRIVTESYNSREYGPGTIRYTWDGNKVTSMVDENRDQEVYFTYNNDGSLATQRSYSNGKEILLEFYGEQRDSHGNWTSRKFRRQASDGYTSSSTSGTQRRTIRYY